MGKNVEDLSISNYFPSGFSTNDAKFRYFGLHHVMFHISICNNGTMEAIGPWF